MNRTALLEVLNRPIPGGQPVGQTLADPSERPAVSAGQNPQARLWRLLDIRAAQDDATETEANVKAVYEDIMDLFRDHPSEAGGWFLAWRAAHPTARLA